MTEVNDEIVFHIQDVLKEDISDSHKIKKIRIIIQNYGVLDLIQRLKK